MESELSSQIIDLTDLTSWRQKIRLEKRKLVVTNGCFDILHAGHVRYLNAASQLGDLLIVGMNDDASVRELKGPTRPVNTATDRAEVLLGLRAVDAVTIFTGKRCHDFLDKVQADVYVKGGDYASVDDLDQGEVEIIRSHGGDIQLLPLVPGKSTTNTIEKMKC